MTGKSFVEAWNEFFFAEQSPIPIALFRILYGMAVLATLCLSRETGSRGTGRMRG